MKLQINITKDILKRSMMCGVYSCDDVSDNCAIALAVKDLFSKATVGISMIHYNDGNGRSDLPNVAKKFISTFDRLSGSPKERLDLPEFSFEIEVPNEVIDQIGLEQVYSILENHKSMQLIES